MSLFTDRPNQALLVVDAQVGVLDGCAQPEAVVATIADLVARARIAEVPVVWVRDRTVGVESAQWQLVGELIPEQGEVVIDKSWPDSFAETELDDVLGGLGVGDVVVAGARSDFCIRSTVFGAAHRGYDVTLVADAHTTREGSFEQTRFSADDLVALTNRLVWTTRLPGVDVRLVASSDLAFTPPAPDPGGLPCGSDIPELEG